MSGDTRVMDAKTIRMSAPAIEKPRTKPRIKESAQKTKSKSYAEAAVLTGVSPVAVFGTLIVASLMILVIFAQIYYNETATEAVRANAELRELTERHRVLELQFESSFDIQEVERIAKDELGMTRPDAAQIITISGVPRDTATVVVGAEEAGTQGFMEYIKSLLRYIKN